MANLKFKKNVPIGTAVFSAVSLKLCCWGPLLLTGIVGISGSSVYFSWLTLLKPYLLTLAFVSLCIAFFQVYKTNRSDSCENCVTKKKSFIKSKLSVWLVAVFIILMTLISYYPKLFYQNDNEKEVIIVNKSNVESVKLIIEGMTCTGCEENINNSIKQLEGIIEINTSYKTGTSDIKFDKRKTGNDEIKEAIQSKGYVIKNVKNE
jgi:mercuric ion transport protein